MMQKNFLPQKRYDKQGVIDGALRKDFCAGYDNHKYNDYHGGSYQCNTFTGGDSVNHYIPSVAATAFAAAAIFT